MPFRPLSLAHRRRCSRRGFTAVEMLVVLALLGMMMLMSLPALMDFFRAIRVRSAQERLTSHLRLCRQIAVTRRAHVVMEIEGKGAQSTYRAWEDLEPSPDHFKDADEPWVVREDRQLEQDRVHVSDAYNDETPANQHDESITSVLESDKLVLRFDPKGQVLRINPADDTPYYNDTIIRVRLRGLVNAGRCDQWEVSLNRPGKVAADGRKIEEPEDTIPADCTM